MGTNDSAALLPYMAVFVRVVEAGSPAPRACWAAHRRR